MRPLLLALALLTAAPDASAQIGRVVPADPAAEDPSWVLFRGRLLQALQARDADFVLRHTAADVRLGFGGYDGIDVLRARLQGTDPVYGEEDVFALLTEIVSMGSSYDRGERIVMVPYYFDGPWPDGAEPFTHQVVIGENVNVRAAPSTSAAVIAQLTYDVVPVALQPPTQADGLSWAEITLADGRVGFIAARFLGSGVGYRAGFERIDGRWTMTFFLAGD